MGLSTKKQSSKTKSTENVTTTPTVAPWLGNSYQNLGGRIDAMLNTDPNSFVAGPSQLQSHAFGSVGKLGAGQAAITDAIDMAKNLPGISAKTVNASQAGYQGYSAPQLGDAFQTDRVDVAPMAKMQSQSLLDGFEHYLDPSTRQLVDAALTNYDAQTGRQAASLAARGAANGAFGGSRYGLAEGQFAGESDRNRALTEAELRSRAFTQAAQLANMDAERRQGAGAFNAGAENTRSLTQGEFDLRRLMDNTNARNAFRTSQAGFDSQAGAFNANAANTASMFNAGQTNQIALANAGNDLEAQRARAEQALAAAGLVGNLGTARDTGARADIGLTADLGNIQHAIDQAKAGAPLAQLAAAGQLYGGIPIDAFTSKNVNGISSSTVKNKSSGSLLDSALAIGSVIASDRRLKKNIEKVGELSDGLGVYDFDYRQDMDLSLPKGRLRGVMADEVAQLRPWALGPELEGGFATVNYRQLGA